MRSHHSGGCPMPFSDDEQRLTAVRDLLRTNPEPNARLQDELLQMDLLLILPAGWGAGYALDSEGRVAGFKFGGPPHPQQLIELLVGFPYLQRLVFHIGKQDVPVEIPEGIGALAHLKFLSFSGGIRRVPEDILRLNIPIVVLDRGEE